MRERAGSLVLVATPIGNLGDLSPRAAQALAGAALICAEDTRRVAKLLRHAGITAVRVVVANEHTERERIPDVLDTLADGGDVALVSDAGTPGISDPGERIVRAVLDAGHAVTTVPGPVAAVAALVVSGLSTARFVFEGFVPRSGTERARRLAAIAAEPRTVVLYEAPHRIARTIADLVAACGPDRQVVVARELTKLYEEVQRGPLGEIDVGTPRGEYVIVLSGAPPSHEPPDDDTIRQALRHELGQGAGTKEAAAAVAERYGIPKRTAYSLAVGTLKER
ncbi:MAG: 16S rRNA (cytidine(1402)-2'-O)-methyltransferase [Acidimicrobiia bacterium]|nr:16S rRNA (cytidine(1402)-2'-O)-methyltransferase [Acidimicrobiia bacterium]MDQ3390746.1 16S rRNA (cytidine(1402)-2'-O)-methyltransferase [Actinomycetota bacterium]